MTERSNLGIKEDMTMKKFITDIKTVAALLMAMATFAACTNDDNIIDEPPQTATTGTYTVTIEATKGDNAATTRALSLDGKTLNASWAAGEEVTVYNETRRTALGGTLSAQSSGASTTLTGTLTGTIFEDNELTLKFLSPSYGTQDGTLTGTENSIDKVCDYAEATVTVESASDGNITTTEAHFVNKQAIVKFTLKDKDNGGAALNATLLTVNDGTNTYTVTPAAATDVLFVAIPAISNKSVTLTATVGSKTYTYIKNNVTFENGKYYEVSVKMTESVSLAALTGYYEAQNGDILTGTLGGAYKITIAAGATVTLRDANINGNDAFTFSGFAGLTPEGDATIVLEGSNIVKSFNQFYPGIYAKSGYTLTITGTGSLSASCVDYYPLSAGIGAGYEMACGNIVIQGGSITATGGDDSAGIGGARNGNCGDITITGGVTRVTARRGGDEAKSIGAGHDGTCGTVTIGGAVRVPNNASYTYPSNFVLMAADATKVDEGCLICTDGHIHEYGDNSSCNKSRVAKIIYVGSSTDHATYTHGLALALSNGGYGTWDTANSYGSGMNTSTPVTGARWMLPSISQWETMRDAAGGYSNLVNGFSSVGGTDMYSGNNDYYWSGTEDYQDAYYFSSYDWRSESSKTASNNFYRAGLVF